MADFNGDGKADLLWRNTSTGQLYVWYLDQAPADKATARDVLSSLVVTGGSYLTPSAMADASWQIVPR